MPEKTVKIVNRKGLHARSAAKLVALSQNYSCHVELQFGDKRADCRSMMSLMMLAAGMGTEVRIVTDGERDNEAIDAVCELIEAGFHESDDPS